MMKKILIAAACLAASVAGGAQAEQVTFSDGTFADAGWTNTILRRDPGITYSNTQATSGGNPGAYRRFSGLYSGTSFPALLDEAHLKNGAVHNPATQGAIVSVGWSFDIGAFDTHNNVFSLRVIAFQNGSYYSDTGFGLQGSQGWFSPGPQTASQFSRWSGSGPLFADFSSSGAPIQFGYLSTLYFTQANDRAGGIDNWSMTVNAAPVPEPATPVALLGIGLVALARALRRRGRSLT